MCYPWGVSNKRTLRVGVVQARSVNGAMTQNLDGCGHLVNKAAERGAELVLCPEFLAAGYTYDESIWASGEPRGGMTEKWLEACAAKHDITVGASYLEAEGEHFYNTFALADAGGIVARVRKRSLPFFEGWFFTPCDEAKVVDTTFGRIAVGICNDNQTASFMNDVIDHAPDLILMPHSAPSPRLPGPLRVFEGAFRRQYDNALKNVARRYAKAFGVPVLMSNKGSADDDVVHTMMPASPHLPVWPRLGLSWTFDGHSTIVDSDGTTHGYLKGGEGVLVADVTLDPAAKRLRREASWVLVVRPAHDGASRGRGAIAVGEARTHGLPRQSAPKGSSAGVSAGNARRADAGGATWRRVRRSRVSCCHRSLRAAPGRRPRKRPTRRTSRRRLRAQKRNV